jgi:high-affinity Fe2+/Pb2+ permease
MWMQHDPVGPPSLLLVALLVLGGAGIAFVALGVVTAAGWRFFVPGCIALLVSLPGVWMIQRSRDKTLR